MPGEPLTRELNAKSAVECLRSSMTNSEIMERFKITPQGFTDLIRQLLKFNLISEQELTQRGIKLKMQKKDPPQQIPAPLPPPPNAQMEEFLDTVELTELLSFKAPGSRSAPPPKPSPAPPPTEEEKDQSERKGKFSIGGLFKKDK